MSADPLALLYFVLGIVATVVLSSVFREFVARRRRRVSWSAFYRSLTAPSVLHEIEPPEKRPDVIIGLNNGIVPASMLATNFGIQDIYYFHMFPELGPDGYRRQPKLKPRGLDLAGKRVLIVDDQSYTGKSMEALYRHLISQEGAEPEKVVRFACFEYHSMIDVVPLDIRAPHRTRGAIKRVPWSFSDEHRRHYWPRNRRGEANKSA